VAEARRVAIELIGLTDRLGDADGRTCAAMLLEAADEIVDLEAAGLRRLRRRLRT
jgi:hypothetical protein